MADYTAQEVYDLKLLPLKPRTLQAYALRGDIDSFTIGRTRMYSDEGIEKFKDRCRKAGTVSKPSRSPRYAGRN